MKPSLSLRTYFDKQSELPNWLVNTIYGSIRDSDPAMTRFFYSEVKKHAPSSLKYFEEGSTRAPIEKLFIFLGRNHASAATVSFGFYPCFTINLRFHFFGNGFYCIYDSE